MLNSRAQLCFLCLKIHQPPPQSTCVHILHDETLTQDNREKFVYIAGRYGQFVKFYNVKELCADKIAEMIKLIPAIEKSRVSIGAFYKLIIPQVIPSEIEKIIYLDGDIIVNLDIAELWQIDLGDKILGIAPEEPMGDNPKRKKLCQDGYVKIEDYFNSGVMLMNLNLFRGEEENIMQGIKFRGEHPETTQFDQTILNYCFAARSLKLPLHFNRMLHVRRSQETIIGKKIYHYAAHSLNLNQNDILNRLWMSYFIKTPWFNEDAIGRLYEGLLKIRNNLKSDIAKISAIVSGKTRAFFVAPDKIESMKKFFSIRDDELIIPAENQDALKKLLDAMKTSQGKCVFFIMTKKFLKKDFPLDLLTKEGFVLNKDFLKGWGYLSSDYGNPLNSYKLIQVM